MSSIYLSVTLPSEKFLDKASDPYHFIAKSNIEIKMWLYIFLISIPILFLWAESASDSEDDVFGIQRAGELRSEEEVDEKGGDEADGMEFENLVNFRDVGRFINDFLGKKYVRSCVSRFVFHCV